MIPTPSHLLGHISPIFAPFFPVFCAFSPPGRDGSNEPQAGTQGQETAGKGTKRGELPPSFDTPDANQRINWQGLSDWLKWTISEHRPWQPWAKDGARGNLFPFITPIYVGGLEEIGVTMVSETVSLGRKGTRF